MKRWLIKIPQADPDLLMEACIKLYTLDHLFMVVSLVLHFSSCVWSTFYWHLFHQAYPVISSHFLHFPHMSLMTNLYSRIFSAYELQEVFIMPGKSHFWSCCKNIYIFFLIILAVVYTHTRFSALSLVPILILSL